MASNRQSAHRRARGMLLASVVLLSFAGALACFAALAKPKRPANPYMLWLSDNRNHIADELGTKKGADVSKAAGLRWGALGADKKALYEEKAAQLKENFAKEMEQFIASGGDVKKASTVKEASKPTRDLKQQKKPASKPTSKPSRDPNQPKRPATSYMLWLNEERPKLYEELGTKRGVEVAKAAGLKWKSLGAAQKAKYEATALQVKAEYKAQMQEFVEKSGAPPKRPSAKSSKVSPPKKPKKDSKPIKAKKAVDPNAPKRPISAYLLWLNDNREEIFASLPAGSNRVTDVAKKAGALWKDVTPGVKKPYEDQHAKAKAEYQARKAVAA